MRIQYIRAATLILIHVLILAHVFYFKDDIIGSVDFQEFFHSFLKDGIINAGVILVLISFLSTLLFGRFFCGWACHFGAVQELSWIILKKLNIKHLTINSRLVVILPLIILLNYYVIPNVWSAFTSTDQWNITIKLNEPNIWEFLPGFAIGILTFIVDGFLIVYFLGRKGFCRFICPWGAFLKLPNLFAPFKVRKTGECTLCHECTSGCPVGIDVSYEINKFGKVNNTNCTSCMICTSGCPENALSYSYKNPLEENFSIKDFLNGRMSYLHQNIKGQFISFRHKDILLLALTIIFGLSIDGLYGMGHFLSYGIAIISAIIILKPFKNKFPRIIMIGLLSSLFIWHGTIKYSVYKGIKEYKSQNYEKSIFYLEKAVILYPKQLLLSHTYLSLSYFYLGDFDSCRRHAIIAEKINPEHESVRELYKVINYQE